MTAEDLFGNPDRPAHQAEPAKAPKAPLLYEAMLAKFKSHKFQTFTRKQIVAGFPERKPEQVEKALRKLIRHKDVRVVPSTDGIIRYTVTIYKSS